MKLTIYCQQEERRKQKFLRKTLLISKSGIINYLHSLTVSGGLIHIRRQIFRM